ncbi:MAG: helix-turn-helix transcriptional regulator [Clostridia bacterium]|nr:helix-turn-helix transcriptional regulator [Clostridia bacterium]MBQ9781458.1 helix-turn-helix transcriptional regulator [Clostridia bacterium]
MPSGISMQTVPTYRLSAFRKFLPNERHITRVESSDILLLMLDGVLRFTEDGVSVELSRGEYYIQQRGLFQDGPEVSECPVYFYLHFGECTWSDEAPALPRRGLFDPDALLPLLRELNNAENENAPRVVKNGLLCTILTRLFRGQARSERDMLVDHMVHLLTQDLQKPPTLAELSSVFHFSENYLIRIFRENMGLTPHVFVNAARIRKAKLLLSTSNITADRVAYECGFSDYAHFYRTFRREIGCTPKEYRQEMLLKKG